jgi:hypothetical protein
MRKNRCLCGGVCLACIAAALLVETAHLGHTAVCLEQRIEPDLGPPEGCNEREQPHSRNVSITALATANATSSSATVVTSQSLVLFDADDVRLDQQPPFTTEEPGPLPPRES